MKDEEGREYTATELPDTWISDFRKEMKELCEKYEQLGVTRVMLVAFLSNAVGKLMPTVPAEELDPASVGLTVHMNMTNGYNEVMEELAPLANPQGSA